MPESVATRFAQCLKSLGIRYLFGVPSGSMIDYIQAIHDTKGIEFILCCHEANAAFMAGVCGRLTGLPGVCFATFGPGATNLATGVGAALLDRAPLLAFTDEMPDDLRNRTVQMNIDHQALFAPLTKATCRLTPNLVEKTLAESAAHVMSGVPGPVHIGVPSNISLVKTPKATVAKDVIQLPDLRFPTKNGSPPLAADAIKKIQALLSDADRPVLALGLSAARPGIKPLILQFLDTFKIPVVLTPMAKGLVSEDHPCYAGVLNHALSDRVAQTHKSADLVISIGYDPVEVNYEEWVSNQPIIHIDRKPADIDPEELTLACDITADVKEAVEGLLTIEPLVYDWDLTEVEKRKNRMFLNLKSDTDMFGPSSVLDELRKKLPASGILTCDVGAHLHLIGQKWITPDPDTLLMTNGWSSMGFAIPAAIAAKLCRPDKKVACVIGDGGFLMSAGELATAQRLALNIVFILLVDHDLSLIRIKQEKKGLAEGYGTRISNSDLFDVPSIFGVPVWDTGSVQAFSSALEKAFQKTGPIIIKAMIDPGEYKALLLRGNS